MLADLSYIGIAIYAMGAADPRHVIRGWKLQVGGGE